MRNTNLVESGLRFGTSSDEYDGYLGGVYQLLVDGASDEQIAEHLWRIVTERMGLGAKISDMADTVTALRQLSVPENSSSAEPKLEQPE